MKKTRNTALLLAFCALSSLNASAQIKKDAVKKEEPKPVEAAAAKPQRDTVPRSGEDLLESIQRDIKQGPTTTPMEINAAEMLPTAEKVANEPQKTTERPHPVYVPPSLPPRPPRIRKPIVPHHHELQLEAGAFLNQAFRVFGLVKDGEPYKASPYILGYKYKLSTKSMEGIALRTGFGGFFDRKEETLGGFKDKKQNDTSALSGRIGIEFQRDLGDHFRWLFGADAILQNNQKRIFSDSGIDQITDKTTGFTKGFGLMVGLRWDFTEKASIGSEMNIQFLNFQGEQTISYTANPQFNKVLRTVNNTSTYYLGPANVYISWRF
jgi:hypothetical protein